MSKRKNRSATSVNFGWDFQRNAGIVLALENMDNLSEIRLEGKSEDIEITLKNGNAIYAQAKSVVELNDYRNVKKKSQKIIINFE